MIPPVVIDDLEKQRQRLRTKVFHLVTDAETAGQTKTQLLQATRAPASLLTGVLDAFVAEFVFVVRQERKSQWGLGRQPVRYWLRDHAPALTVPEPGDIPVLEPGQSPPKGSTCKQCGRAMPAGPGRPPEYCSPACRDLAGDGGIKLGDFFARATDPRAFSQCATLLVTMDLICRGFRVTPLVYHPGGSLVVLDDAGAAMLLTVIPVSQAGYFPPPSEYDSVACVYLDGRIQYGGKNPLVVSPEAIEDTSTPTEK